MNFTKRHKNRLRAILVDFDGVLRSWPDSDSVIEKKYGLITDSIREAAFEPDTLDLAIRGLISDEEWRKNIMTILHHAQPDADVASAINEWSVSYGEVDRELLALLSACKPYAEILLITNATSRLIGDLVALGLDDWFTKILNSSDIGCVKPEPEIYQIAIQACSCALSDIVYIDDSLPNTIAAEEKGIVSHHYTGFDNCKQFLLENGLLGKMI